MPALSIANRRADATNYVSQSIARANLDGTGGINLGDLGGLPRAGLCDPCGIALDHALQTSQIFAVMLRAGAGGVAPP